MFLKLLLKSSSYKECKVKTASDKAEQWHMVCSDGVENVPELCISDLMLEQSTKRGQRKLCRSRVCHEYD